MKTMNSLNRCTSSIAVSVMVLLAVLSAATARAVTVTGATGA